MSRLFTDDASAIMCIWAEARGEPHAGKVAVGEVLRNRTMAKFFSHGTIVSTVWFPSQFSWTLANDPNRMPALQLDDDDAVVAECARAWFESEDSNLTGNAVQYYAASMRIPPAWSGSNEFEKTVQIGQHVFFRRRVSVPGGTISSTPSA